MNLDGKARVSRRWYPPEPSRDGSYWRARLRDVDPTVMDTVACGPDRDACVREAERLDGEWVAAPKRTGDRDTARERLLYLARGGVA